MRAHRRRAAVAGRPEARRPRAGRTRAASADSGTANVRMPQPSVASSLAAVDAARLGDRRRASRPGAGGRRGSSRRAASPRPGSGRARTRACPSSCGGSATALRAPAARGSSGSSGPQASASSSRPHASSTSATTPTCAAEPPCDAQASARCRVAELEALEHAGAHAAERLQRLDRGAREHGQVGIRAGRPHPSGSATHQATRCSDSTAPPRSATTRVRSASPASARGSRSISRSATSRPYQPSTTTSLPSGCL